MDRALKERIEKRRKETSIKTMYFNRFLLIRYITAGFFFVNLYWFLSLIMSNGMWAVVPGINLVFIIGSAWEQGTMYSSPIDNAKKTIFSFKVILTINIMLVAALFTPIFNKLFPFLKNNMKSYIFILGISLIGIILSSICLRRLKKIKNRTDKQFIYVKQLEKTIN